jgi:hypothetical protein
VAGHLSDQQGKEPIMNETKLLRYSLLQEAVARKLLTRKEYVQLYRGKYQDEEKGTDTFFDYLTAVLCFPDRIFETEDPRLLADADALLDRFGMVIEKPVKH